MKREILFKAKRVDNGEWVEGLPCYLTGYAKDFHEVDGIQCDKTREYYDVNPETVCQFIKDDLFENDIVERIEHKCNGEETIGKYQIVWDENELRWALKTIKSIVFRKKSIVGFNGELTKVGNIYDK